MTVLAQIFAIVCTVLVIGGIFVDVFVTPKENSIFHRTCKFFSKK